MKMIELTSESEAYKTWININHISAVSTSSSGFMVEIQSGNCYYLTEESYNRLIKVVSAANPLI